MDLSAETIISAQVILRSASGKEVNGNTQITAANIADYEPLPETVDEVSKIFTALGFEIDAFLGISFSVTASADTFKKVFRVKLHKTESGGIEWLDEDNQSRLELPMTNLPAELTQYIQTVTFTPPPEFGPADF